MTDHDPGGKSRLPLRPGVSGDALFAGENREHRLWLARTWGPGGYMLCIGMNPSTANHLEDDLTLRKDQEFARRAGMASLIKANAASYRCTDPARLPRGVVLNHPENHPTVMRLAADAGLVLLATGEPPDVLLPHFRTLLRLLRQAGVPMHCLGVTKGGWPRHTSRLAYETPMVGFL